MAWNLLRLFPEKNLNKVYLFFKIIFIKKTFIKIKQIKRETLDKYFAPKIQE